MSGPEIIYLMGSGRSGTTVLSVILGNNKDIDSLGELHHLYHVIKNNGNCSCGRSFLDCEYWSVAMEEYLVTIYSNSELYNPSVETKSKIEKHKYILPYVLNYQDEQTRKFTAISNTLFEELNKKIRKKYLLDSSKYIARLLLLRRSPNLNIKTILVVRDIRGVIWSFKKKVQTPQSPLKTLIYYNYINLMGEIVYRLLNKDEIIKVKYEDFIKSPEATLLRISDFLKIDLSMEINKIKSKQNFKIPHLIGGNRLTKKSNLILRADLEWKSKLSFLEKVIYYFLSLPINIINKYRP